MRGDRRHSLPPPTYLSLHTHSHTGIRTLANCSPCLGHLDYFILFKSGTCRGLKDRTPGSQRTLPYKNRLAQEQDRCIIQMTARALDQSFMWISSSWLQKMEEAGSPFLSATPKLRRTFLLFQCRLLQVIPLNQSSANKMHRFNLLKQSDRSNEARMPWQDFDNQKRCEELLGQCSTWLRNLLFLAFLTL